MRLRLRPSAIVRVRKSAFASGLAIERSETVSVVSAPSLVAATMASPSRRDAMSTRVPSAIVTKACDGKHGSSALVAALEVVEGVEDNEVLGATMAATVAGMPAVLRADPRAAGLAMMPVLSALLALFAAVALGSTIVTVMATEAGVMVSVTADGETVVTLEAAVAKRLRIACCLSGP